jgi:hypothetical protein
MPKKILFEPTEYPGTYNLEFGDITTDGDVDVYKRSNNGDRGRILATIAKAVKRYTEGYPDRWVHFTGSTDERTRLYRIAIGLHLDELSVSFDICTKKNGELIPFQKDMNADDFFVRRKDINLVPT